MPRATASRPPACKTSASAGRRATRAASTIHTSMAKHSDPAASSVFETWMRATRSPLDVCATNGTTRRPASTSSSPKWNTTSVRPLENREAAITASIAAAIATKLTPALSREPYTTKAV